ncbi:MAG: TauD/TfdA family dioxygenase [Gammaproteobacteria bacterium]|nr:TauD/TfdA family dioxygenase [Gammaproteobacteria bacterium]MDH3468863.1 TauD/TfdA family dioxygenase [Gammaproteobacteria bacterium]
MNTDYTTIEVTPLSRSIGAELSGVDIAAGICAKQFAEIQRAFIDHSVIFFRDQDLSPEQHIEFARCWGEINVNRFFQPVESHPLIAEVRKEPDQRSNIGSVWHTDHSYDQIPAMGSILYARAVPEVGGDTMYSSMYAAYESLSDGMKKMLHGLRAEHSSRHVFGEQAYVGRDLADINGRLGNTAAATQDAHHPVVIRHPFSGRPALYVNEDFTVKFEGWSKEESQPLLDYLYQHARQNEFTCRFKWRVGSMAIWDNRATHHYALNDYHGDLRLMHRITIEGEALTAAA